MNSDFKNAQLPELLPLKNSVAQGNFETENQLRNLFLALFNYHKSCLTFDSDTITFDASITFDADILNSEKSLAELVFDANALGMAQIGSFELIRRMVNTDGLVLLPGVNEEIATRYVYKAWRSRNSQGRGFHFLRTYLKMLLPDILEIEQLAQPKAENYPSRLIPWINANENDYFLTSRVLILLDLAFEAIAKIAPVLRDIVAARFVLHFGKIKIIPVGFYVGCSVISGAMITVYPLPSDFRFDLQTMTFDSEVITFDQF